MFYSYFYHGNAQINVLRSPHVPRVGERVHMHNKIYKIIDVTYELNGDFTGPISVLIQVAIDK